MNVGIVVEGEQDGAAYPELIRKIRGDIEGIFSLPCGGVGTLRKEFVGLLKQLPWRAPHPIDGALELISNLTKKQRNSFRDSATAPVYKEIASFVDIARISALCPNFRRFVDKIRAL
jgi:hypothetical protein